MKKFLILVLCVNIIFTSCTKQTEVPILQKWRIDLNPISDNNLNEISVAIISNGIDIYHPDLKMSNIEEISIVSEEKLNDFEVGTMITGVLCAAGEKNGGS